MFYRKEWFWQGQRQRQSGMKQSSSKWVNAYSLSSVFSPQCGWWVVSGSKSVKTVFLFGFLRKQQQEWSLKWILIVPAGWDKLLNRGESSGENVLVYYCGLWCQSVTVCKSWQENKCSSCELWWPLIIPVKNSPSCPFCSQEVAISLTGNIPITRQPDNTATTF